MSVVKLNRRLNDDSRITIGADVRVRCVDSEDGISDENRWSGKVCGYVQK